jgi:hypothetical protein
MEQYCERLMKVFDLWNSREFRHVPLIRPRLEVRDIQDLCRFVPGKQPQYVVNENLLNGDHPDLRSGDACKEGRFNFTADCIVHCMARHAANVPGHSKVSDHHVFRNVCNEISMKRGWQQVRSIDDRNPLFVRRPLADFWPWNVRPTGFYENAETIDWPARETIVLLGSGAFNLGYDEWIALDGLITQGLRTSACEGITAI